MGSTAASTTAAVAPGVMPNQVLGGPVWWFFFGVYLLAIALALFCLVDSLLPRRRERFAQLPEPAWLYTAVFGVFVAFVAGVWVPIVPRIVAVVPVFMTPVALAVGVAYLLRVVFPKPQPAEASVPTDDALAAADDAAASDTESKRLPAE